MGNQDRVLTAIHEAHNVYEQSGVTFANFGAISAAVCRRRIDREIRECVDPEDGFSGAGSVSSGR